MTNIDELVSLITKRWGGRTLQQLREEALLDPNRSVFEAIRAEGGQRMVVMVCLTARGHILEVEQAFDLVDDGNAEDWNTLTLVEVFARTVRAGGFCFEAVRDEEGRRVAVVLIATEPRSIAKLELLGNLPS